MAKPLSKVNCHVRTCKNKCSERRYYLGQRVPFCDEHKSLGSVKHEK
jgi:hypothetical protein